MCAGQTCLLPEIGERQWLSVPSSSVNAISLRGSNVTLKLVGLVSRILLKDNSVCTFNVYRQYAIKAVGMF